VHSHILEWTEKHRAKATYGWYRERLQWFLRSLPTALTVGQLRPFHLQNWLDARPGWSDGHRRGCITAVQRAFHWATRMGYIDRSPVEQIEKPTAGKRETLISQKLYETLLSLVRDQEFRELIEVSWETGCRPQESLRIESRHVDLRNARWVFVPTEAKVKTRPRIVYLTDTAFAITKRRMLKWPEGPIFRNTDGRPWTRHAVSCRFGRLQKKLGVKLCLYALRHTWVNRLLTSGVDALTVAILAGHADPSTLARTYQHLSHEPSYLRDALKRLTA
jgi:integrase